MTIKELLKSLENIEYKYFHLPLVKSSDLLVISSKISRTFVDIYGFKVPPETIDKEKYNFIKATKEAPYRRKYLNKDYLFYKNAPILNSIISAALSMSVDNVFAINVEIRPNLKYPTALLDATIRGIASDYLMKAFIKEYEKMSKEMSSKKYIHKIDYPLNDDYPKYKEGNKKILGYVKIYLGTNPISIKSLENSKELKKVMIKDFEVLNYVKFEFSFEKLYFASDLF